MLGRHASSIRPPYAPLHEASPVLLHRNACVALRSRYAECRHCERICPTGALKIERGAIGIEGQCIGCGRCMAACPTGALQVRGFFPRIELAADDRVPVTVDCARAPKAATVRVPCLGGLSVSRLLALRLIAGEREVQLLDRGWCAGCPAANAAREHPAAKSLGRAQARLRDAGVPERLLPRLQAMPLPVPKKARVSVLAPNLARRSMLSAFTRPLQGPSDSQRFAAEPAPERERVLVALAKLAARYGGRVSEKLFHAVQIDAQLCQAHGVCAAGCPTGALRASGREGAMQQLSHASALCIGCGHCERVCPEKAVRLVHGAGDPRVPRRIVAQFERRACEACGAQRAVSARITGRRSVCERCAKSRALAHAAFQKFHGSRAVDGL